MGNLMLFWFLCVASLTTNCSVLTTRCVRKANLSVACSGTVRPYGLGAVPREGGSFPPKSPIMMICALGHIRCVSLRHQLYL